MEQKVAFLLHHFPETRESDIALCIRYWRRFQADVIEQCDPFELEVLFGLHKLETIGRIRRHIQELGLFRGTEETARQRGLIQQEFHEYLAAHKGALPEVRFYLDETGLEGGKAFLGIGGVCVINWQQYEKHGAALAQWRREQNWPEPIHFVEMGSDRVDRAVGLLAELDKRRGGLLFLGYVLNSRGFSHADLFSLFIQLVIDSLRALRDAKCLEEPRAVRIIKEAETGIDTMYLDKMHKPLSDLIAVEFPGRLLLHPIEPVVKGS